MFRYISIKSSLKVLSDVNPCWDKGSRKNLRIIPTYPLQTKILFEQLISAEEIQINWTSRISADQKKNSSKQDN